MKLSLGRILLKSTGWCCKVRLKQKKYQQILLKPLVHGKINKDLYDLAIKVAAKQPDIIRRAEELMKANK